METEEKENLSHNLKKLRAQNCLSQEKLAEKANVSLNCLCKIEQKSGDPKFSTLCLLAKALNCNVENLVHFDKFVIGKENGKIEISQQILGDCIDRIMAEKISEIRRVILRMLSDNSKK